MEPATVSPTPALEPLPEKFPGSPARVILMSVLALAAGIGGTIWIEQIRFEKLSGFLQARMQTVAAGRNARIARILVEPGALVCTGQPLVILDDESLHERLVSQQRAIESLEIELAQTEARLEVELEWRRKDLLERIFEAKLKSVQINRQQSVPQIETPFRSEPVFTLEPVLPPVVQASHESSPIFLGDRLSYDNLQRVRPVPEAVPETVREPDRGTAAELKLCAEHILELERMNRDLPEKIGRSMGVNLARARLDHARTELAALESRKRELTVVAPTPGLIGVFQKVTGDHVRTDEPIVQLLDEDRPFLILQIPSTRIADFAPGTIVELCFPGGKRGNGRVEEIPPQTSPVPTEGMAPSETIITAHVEPVGTLWPSLPFGSVVEVRRKR